MTWQEWMAARTLIFQEQIGQHLRSSENRQAQEYAKSAARLRAAAAREAAKES